MKFLFPIGEEVNKMKVGRKKFNDLLYGWLLLNSNIHLNEVTEEKIRIIYPSKISFSAYAKVIGRGCFTRKSLKKDFENLIEMGLIETKDIMYNGDVFSVYHFVETEKTMTLEDSFLELFCTEGYLNLIKVYCYLLYNFRGSKKGGNAFKFSKTRLLKEVLGLDCTNHGKNWKDIEEILNFLESSEILAYQKTRFVTNKGQITYLLELMKVEDNIKKVKVNCPKVVIEGGEDLF